MQEFSLGRLGRSLRVLTCATLRTIGGAVQAIQEFRSYRQMFRKMKGCRLMNSIAIKHYFFAHASETLRRPFGGGSNVCTPEFLSCAKATDDHSVCVCECKGTLMKRGFANFRARKCKKLVLCNVEITNGVFRVVESC